jgi:hypothetical protein
LRLQRVRVRLAQVLQQQVLVQELRLLAREPARERERERLWVQSRHRNQRQQWLESSCHHASIDPKRFSIRHQPNCASCEFLVRQPRMQMLQLRGMRRSC